MVCTLYSFFTGLIIVFILHFLAKHYLRYCMLHSNREEGSKRVREGRSSPLKVHFDTTPIIYEIPFHEEDVSEASQTRSTVDIKSELIRFAKDYQEPSELAIAPGDGLSEEDGLSEFFQIQQGVYYNFDAAPSNVSRPVASSQHSIQASDPMDMSDSFAAL
jgi:hypothetical protein